MKLPIRVRLTIWYVALLAVILTVLGAFLVVRLRSDLVHGIDRGLGTRAAQIALGLRNGCEGEFQDVSDASLIGLPQGESGAQLLSRNGQVLESTGDPVAKGALVPKGSLPAVFAGSRVLQTISSGGDGESFRILAVQLPGGSCTAAVVVATSLEDVSGSVHRLMALLLVAGPAALFAAGAGGWWLARKALAPVSQMTREAGEIGIDRLDERVDVPGSSDELYRLATTLNTMLDRLEHGVEEKRRFVADASHELRTPLAVMRSELDVSLRSLHLTPASREVLESASEEVDRMSGIVENLLTLARIDEGGLQLLRERVDLHDLAESAVGSVRPLADAKGVHVDVAGDPAAADADRARVELVVSNLVANAVKFSRPGDRVSVTSWLSDAQAGCTVRDTGPGIQADLLPHIFDRFVRADPARTSGQGGSGLGLAICREIVEAHGGRIWVESQVGRGSAFSFTVPAASDRAGEGARGRPLSSVEDQLDQRSSLGAVPRSGRTTMRLGHGAHDGQAEPGSG